MTAENLERSIMVELLFDKIPWFQYSSPAGNLNHPVGKLHIYSGTARGLPLAEHRDMRITEYVSRRVLGTQAWLFQSYTLGIWHDLGSRWLMLHAYDNPCHDSPTTDAVMNVYNSLHTSDCKSTYVLQKVSW
jgi:hypothetical protein